MASTFTSNEKHYQWEVIELNNRLSEKFEEKRQPEKINTEQVPKLPLSEQECTDLLNILGKIALQTQNKYLIHLYLELERRIIYGNRHLYPTEEMKTEQVIDQILWNIFSGQNEFDKSILEEISIPYEEYQILLALLSNINEKEPNQEIQNAIQVLKQNPEQNSSRK